MTDEIAPALLKVEPATIRAYAQLTDDFNPIHLDPVFAASTPMGGVIAHGTMSICLLWQAVYRAFGAQAFESVLDLDIRFLKPVREGETLSAGGRRNAEVPGCYDVWVRGENGEDRLAGQLRVAAAAGGLAHDA
ncbi:MAG: MaoC/PaaZ C-terminal domain-containing protein [Burkholderiaceae bacterium]